MQIYNNNKTKGTKISEMFKIIKNVFFQAIYCSVRLLLWISFFFLKFQEILYCYNCEILLQIVLKREH